MYRLRSRTQTGFTIVELMITITILSVLMAVAIPSFNNMIQNSRRTAAVNELIANLMLARSEAVKRGQAVTVCSNTSGGGMSCTGGTNWNYGWMIFLDPDGDGAIAATSDVLRQYVNESAGSGLTVTSATGGTGHVTLRPFNQAGTAASVTVCDKRGAAEARRVCVSNNGRARVSEKACNGTDPITCPS